MVIRCATHTTQVQELTDALMDALDAAHNDGGLEDSATIKDGDQKLVECEDTLTRLEKELSELDVRVCFGFCERARVCVCVEYASCFVFVESCAARSICVRTRLASWFLFVRSFADADAAAVLV